MQHVPVLDLRDFDADRDAFIAKLTRARTEIGFFSLAGHSVPRHALHGGAAVGAAAGFDRPALAVGEGTAEVRRTNWPDEVPVDPLCDLGTVQN